VIARSDAAAGWRVVIQLLQCRFRHFRIWSAAFFKLKIYSYASICSFEFLGINVPGHYFIMSEVIVIPLIDLSKEDDDDVNNEPLAKRSRPSQVYIVIHDQEPQDSGSDKNCSCFVPSRQDTKIVGVFYSYADAAYCASEYVQDDLWAIDDGGEGEDDETDDFFLSNVDWTGIGYFRQEERFADERNDRVHIQTHNVS
jgi:hypothetical protein